MQTIPHVCVCVCVSVLQQSSCVPKTFRSLNHVQIGGAGQTIKGQLWQKV